MAKIKKIEESMFGKMKRRFREMKMRRTKIWRAKEKKNQSFKRSREEESKLREMKRLER